MKIRRKLPKPSGSGQPLYVIGYSAPAPTRQEIQCWFDLEYGGPLKLKELEKLQAGDHASAPVLAAHGPWNVWVQPSFPDSEAEQWARQLDWRHTAAGAVRRPAVTPHQACDLILHAARLARGLTLLTQGTAYDPLSYVFLNPSDWTDRPLDRFRGSDHVTALQTESPDPATDWFHTLGMTKFGLDELEVFRPVGLPSQPVLDILIDMADEVLRMGRSPTIGATLTLPSRQLSARVVRHRTAAPGGLSLAFRELTWQ